MLFARQVRGHHRIPVIRLAGGTCPGPGGPVSGGPFPIYVTHHVKNNKMCHVIVGWGYKRIQGATQAPYGPGTSTIRRISKR
jgi:hypothetical protein